MAADNSGDSPRKTRGRPFPKGVSPNPGGKSAEREALRRYIVEELGKSSIDGIEKLSKEARSEKVRLDAYIWLAEQAVGKAVQAISAPDGGPLVDIGALAVTLRKYAGEDDA